jgi:chemotaxis protein histidine kinase CheA
MEMRGAAELAAGAVGGCLQAAGVGGDNRLSAEGGGRRLGTLPKSSAAGVSVEGASAVGKERLYTADGQAELAQPEPEPEPEPELAEPDQQPALAEAESEPQSGDDSDPETLAAEMLPEAEAEQWKLAVAAADRAHSLFEQEQALATATSAVAGAMVLRRQPEPELEPETEAEPHPSADVVQFSLEQVQLIAAAAGQRAVFAAGPEVDGADAEADELVETRAELDDTLDDADEVSSDEVDDQDAVERHAAEKSAEEQLWAMWQQDVEMRAQARTERQAAEALRAHSPTTGATTSSTRAVLGADQGGRVAPLSSGLDTRSPFEGWYSCGTLVGLTSEAEPATVPTTCGFLEKDQIVEILEVATTTSGRLRGRTRHGWVSFRERDGKAILLPVSGSVGLGAATPKRKKKRGNKKKKQKKQISSSESVTPRVRESGELFGSSTARQKAERQARRLLEGRGFDRATFIRIERWITVIEMHHEKRVSDRYLKLLIHQVRSA